MSYLIDDVAKTLASPMPRRKAFRYLAGVLMGGIFAPLAMACGASGCQCSNGSTCTSGICVVCQQGGSACISPGEKCCHAATNGGNTNGSVVTTTSKCCCNGAVSSTSVGQSCAQLGTGCI
jgi:hypothetical protein